MNASITSGANAMQGTLAVARIPMVRRYGFLLRFMVLVAIWAQVSYDYRFLLVQTPLGIVTSLVFFAASILALFGFRTRTAMVVLAGSMLAHGYLFHQKYSIASAVLALITALLPIGENYSVDRYLETNRNPVWYVPSVSPANERLGPGWRILFIAFVVFNIGGPTYNQIFHHHVKALRSWDMFHTAGRDLVNVRFFHGNDREGGYINYMSALGYRKIDPSLMRNRDLVNDMRIIGTAKLDETITRMCAAVRDPGSLRLDAKIVALKHGWVNLYNGDPVCTATGQPRLKHPYPNIEEPGLGYGDEGEGA